MASCSSGLEGNVQEFGRRFAVFETFCYHAECQGLHSGDRIIAIVSDLSTRGRTRASS